MEILTPVFSLTTTPIARSIAHYCRSTGSSLLPSPIGSIASFLSYCLITCWILIPLNKKDIIKNVTIDVLTMKIWMTMSEEVTMPVGIAMPVGIMPVSDASRDSDASSG